MRRLHLIQIVFLVLGLVLVSGSASAQRLHTMTYGVNDGMGSAPVYDLAQDEAGHIWLATRRGITRYDGMTWKTLDGVTTDLVHGAQFVEVDDQGRLWSVTLLPSLVVICRNQQGELLQELTPSLESNNATATSFALMTDDVGTVHIALTTSKRELAVWDGSAWRVWNTEQDFKRITSLLFENGTLMIGSHSGLWRLEPEGELEPIDGLGLPSDLIHSLCPAGGGGMWVVGGGWLARIDGHDVSIVADHLELKFRNNIVGVTAQEDPLGGLYFGGFEVVHYFNPVHGVLESLTHVNGLNGDGATDIMVDHEGNVWISNLRGLTKIIGRDFVTYDSRQGLLVDEVTAVLERRDKSIVLGHKGGLTFLGDPLRTIAFPEDRKIGRISDMREGPDGALWIAADRSGLVRWTPEEGFIWWGEEAGLPSVVFTVLFLDDGSTWVGARYGIYTKKSGDHFQKTTFDIPHFSDQQLFIRRMSLARNGDVLIATGHNGVIRYHEGTFQQFIDSDVDEANSTYSAVEDSKGRIWVGTSDGLRVIRDGALRRPGPFDPQVTDPIYAVLEDGNGHLWFGTDRGVQKWDGHSMTLFNSRLGLLGNEVNRAALQLDSRGRVWIGTESGLSCYDENSEYSPLAPPLLELTGIDLGAGLLPLTKSLSLGLGPKTIEIRFNAMSYVDEQGLLFRTWLEGYEEEWRSAHLSPLRLERYVNVPPGQYSFHIQAIGSGGLESEIVTSPEISIRAHFWQEVWFIGLVALFLILVLWSIISVIAGRRYAHKLELEVISRTRELMTSKVLLQAKSERLNTVLEHISDAVIVLDADHIVTLCNPGGLRLMGLDEDDVVGHSIGEVLPSADEWLDQATSPPPQGVFELCESMSQGEPTFLEMALATMYDDDQALSGILMVVRDVTGQRNAESERVRSQRLESLGVLAGGIAHDFNNLLMVILGNTSLLEENEMLDDLGRESIESVMTAGHRARQLTEHLLTFARGGAPQRRVISLKKVVDSAAKLVMSGSNVIADVDMATDLPNVDADPSQMSQVVSNLMINARQAMPDGGYIRVRGRVLDQAPKGFSGHHYLSLTISDDGPGIASDMVDRIFEPYYTTKESGTGLGLAIVYSVVKRHGGKILVRSKEGEGTTFEVILPTTHQQEESSNVISPNPVPLASRVLVLDDESSVCMVIQRILVRLGTTVVSVPNGQKAVEAFQKASSTNRPFDAIILDLTIPGGMGGLEAFNLIRKIDPNVIAIVSSGYSDDEVMANPTHFGFAASLSKPFERQDLESILHGVLSNPVARRRHS